MWICLLLFIIISSGSIFTTVFFNKRYEETVPLTIFSIVFILYFNGVFGFLKYGCYIILTISMILYFISVYKIIKDKRLKNSCLNTFTPAFLFFIFIFLALIWGNYNKLAYSWDEFSHWADIVKAMYTINDFGTNPLSNSFFKSYPPAMSLFQYFIEILNGSFKEWLLYFSYQIFCFSLFLPFLKNLRFKNLSKNLLILLSIVIMPTIFYIDIYNSLYIDGFLGLLFGFSLALIFTTPKYDGFKIATIIMSIMTLVITKDVGLLFSIITLLIFTIDLLASEPLDFNKKIRDRTLKIILIIISAFLLIIVKLTWNHELSENRITAAFSSKVNIKEFFSILIGHSENYRGIVLSNFISKILTTGIQFGSLVIYNYQIIIVLIFGLYFDYKLYNKINNKAKRNKFILYTIVFCLFIYFVGLLACYMYKFSEYEAINLASYQRYFNIIYTTILMFIFSSLIYIFMNTSNNKKYAVLLLLLILFFAPYNNLFSFISRGDVKESNLIRANYIELTNRVNNLIDDDNSNIFFISEGDQGSNYWIMRYSLRPNNINNYYQWSIGKPFYDGDIWTSDIDAKVWQQILIKDYKYVLLYKVNDYFIENYSCDFKNPKDISENQLYIVNKKTGLLELVKSK